MRFRGRPAGRPTNRVALALWGILLIAAFLRFFELSRYPPALHLDEAVNGINTLQVIRLHQLKVFYPENNGREGLFINLQAIAVWLFGPQAWPLRLVSGIFGTLTVLGLFFLVRELFSARGTTSSAENQRNVDPTWLALVASFLLATSFWHVVVSRIGFRANSSPFWAVWGLYLVLMSWRRISASADAGAAHGSLGTSWLIAFLAGIVFGLGFHSYTAYRVMPLLVGIVFVFQMVEARRHGRLHVFVKYATAVAAGGIIAIVPLVMYFVHHPGELSGRTSQISVFNSRTPARDLAGNLVKTMGMLHVVGDTNPRHNMTGRPWLAWFAGLCGANLNQQRIISKLGRPQLFWPVGIVFLIGLYVALRRFIRQVQQYLRPSRIRAMRLQDDPTPPLQSSFLLLWLAIAAIPAVVSNQDLPHALRTILMLPPVFTFAAMGTMHVADSVARRIDGEAATDRTRAAIRSVGWLCGLLLVGQAYATYFLVWGPDPLTAERFDQAIYDKAEALRALPPERPKYVIVQPGALGIELVQFLTDTYTSETQKQKHIRYVDPDDRELDRLPPGAYVTDLK